MRITLIRPRTGNTPDPPLGLMILSSVAKAKGHHVQLLDPNPSDHDTIQKIVAFNPDVVGFSILTTQISRALNLQLQIKAALPQLITLAGGIHPTALPESTLRTFNFDFVVIGEGELTFPALLSTLKEGTDPADVPGVAWIRDGVYYQNQARAPIDDLDTIPLPDRDSLDFNHYLRPPGNIRGKFLRRATSIITSRGCPFGCVFCSSHGLFGHRVRRRSIANVLAEIQLLKDTYRIDGVWFLDDTLLEDTQWLKELCHEMKTTGLPWGCQAHVRRADESIFRTMRDSGCLQLEFGVESGSERILQNLKKGSDPDDVRRAFAICRKLGLRTLANFMIGIPGETETDAEATLRLAREIRPDHVVVTFTTPLPGSDLYDDAIINGWIPESPDFREDWIIRQTENPAVTMTMAPDVMKRIRKKFDNTFFWTNIKDYFRYPHFVAEVLMHIAKNPRRYAPGFAQTLRTGRLGHLVETIWEEYNRV